MAKKIFKNEWQKEKQKLSEMTFRKKISYLFEYYRSFVFLFIVAFLLIFYIGDAIHQSSREIILQGFFTNDDWNLFDTDEITNDLSNILSPNNKQRIVLDDSLYIELDSSSDYVVASQGKIAAYIATKELDFIVTTESLAKHYTSTIPFMDFEDYLPEDIKDKLKDCFISLDGPENESKAYALDMAKSRFIKGTAYDGMEPYYLIVPSSANSKDETLAFLRYAFDL